MAFAETLTNGLQWWQARFGAIAPVGFELRHFLPQQWTRFHSLPESRRDPESEADRREILDRHTVIGNCLMKAGERIAIFRSRDALPRGRYRGRTLCGQSFDAGVVRFRTHDGDGLVTRCLIMTWQPSFFERLVLDIAHDRESMVTFASLQTLNIYCPYDGGMDVFSTDPSPRDLKARFAAWLSARPDGL